jgi:amidase
MLVAKHWQESTLYQAGAAFERGCNWQSMGPTGKR